MKKILLISLGFIVCKLSEAQNVGINITTPVNTLDIKGSAVIGHHYAGVKVAPAHSLMVQGKVGIGMHTALYDTLDNRLEVDGNGLIYGKLGIGRHGLTTVSPKNTLDIEGGIAIGEYAFLDTAPGNGLIVSGNVGIGVTRPKNKLDIDGGVVIGTYAGGPDLAPPGGLLVSGSVGIGTYEPKNKLDIEGSMVIGILYSGDSIAPVDGLLVQGRVGIGTAIPKNKLDVKGGIAVGGSYAGVYTAADGIIMPGRAGIGTPVPKNMLDVSGAIVIGDTYAGIITAPTNGLLVLGNVGIGTATPESKMDVRGNMTIGGSYGGAFAAPVNGLLVEGRVGLGVISPQNKLDINGSVVIGGLAGSITGPANGLLVQGRVGIGSLSPSVPLEVGVDATTTIGPYFFMNNVGVAPSPPGTFNVPVSIKAVSRIVATEFDANSDERIKRNIVTSANSNDLSTLMKIRVTDYQFKDSIYNGNARIKGFIAQELKEVMPQAVHTNGDYVPDLYCLSNATSYNEINKTLAITLCKPHQLKVGDKIKLFAADGVKEQYVFEVNNDNTFSVANWERTAAGMNPVDKVFVWGKWVNDFHTVDYNQVFAMGISAIQQLAKENEQLKNKTESLEQRVVQLEKLLYSPDRSGIDERRK